MRAPLLVTLAATAGVVGFAQPPKHVNPMIDLHLAKQPVLGLYAPSNPRLGGRGGPGGGSAQQGGAGGAQGSVARPAADAPAPPQKTPAELARDGLAYANADFLFDGSMEGDFERGYPGFTAFMKGIADAGSVEAGASPRLKRPIVVKMSKIGADTAVARQRVARQLGLGVSTVVFVAVETPEELRAGIGAMRFASKGGTRADADVGSAPAFWGLSERDYRAKADVWPLAPGGELTAWAVVETKAGLERVREIAAVKGLAVLFPGAGTLRGVFSTVDSTTGQRRIDTAAWEGAIQRVLAACKEFNVPCGYPANDPQQVEERMKQGFSVFIANWGENGFRAVEHGRKTAGRPTAD